MRMLKVLTGPAVLGLALVVAALAVSLACRGEPAPAPIAAAATPVPTPTLVPIIAPCTPMKGADVDPCAQNAPRPALGGGGSGWPLPAEPESMRVLLDHEPNGTWVTHLVVRATYLPGTVRCDLYHGLRAPNYDSNYYDSDFAAAAATFKCYADLRANEYIVGSGPSTITVNLFRHLYLYGEYDYARHYPSFGGSTLEEDLAALESRIEEAWTPGRESLVFLGPLHDLSVESWMLLGEFDLQRKDDGTVIAVLPLRDRWLREKPDEFVRFRSVLEPTLAVFKTDFKAAHQARLTDYGGRIGSNTGLPMLRSNANQLPQYYRDVGSYDHPDGPPEMPPKPYAPAPETLTATAGDAGEAALTWAAVPGTQGYYLEYRLQGKDEWETLTDSVSGTTYTADRLWCNRAYELRVGSFGDGTTYNSKVGLWSPAAAVTTADCAAQAPVFRGGPYTFSVSVAGLQDDAIGAVSADDLNADPITYSITAGNQTGKFAIDSNAGAITLNERLRVAVGTVYTLTVAAADGVTGGATTTATVTVVAPDCSTAEAVADCEVLLNLRDTLAGTASLNWHETRPMAEWEGITLRGSPSRVTRLNLERKGLTGSVPPELGELAGLSTLDLAHNRLTGGIPPELGTLGSLWNLDLSSNRLTGGIPPELGSLPALAFLILSNNRLTGEIPAELGDLPDPAYLWLNDNQLSGGIPPELGNLTGLEHLWLYGNLLTGTIPSELSRLTNLTLLGLNGNNLVGCVPPGLRSIRTNDIGSLGLADCEEGPPAPTGLDASLTGDTFSLSWTALTGADKYEPQWRIAGSGNAWEALLETTAVSATHTPAGGPVCSSAYEFRVRAHGDGFTYPTHWGPESTAEPVSTPSCPPDFDQDSYTFEVAEDAAVDDPVGTAAATDPDEDTLTYSITGGNTGDAFVIDDETGAITVAAALDHETTGEYTLTVQAADGNGGEDTATVTVTVTDVAEDAPPVPTGLNVSLVDGTFSLSWTALEGVAKYEAQHKTGAADSQWAALPETAGVSAAFTPEGGADCGAEYQFRVRAYGDGVSYTEMWGAESGLELVETATCDPEFGQESYAFEVAEDAAMGDPVGTVSATDPAQDTLTYSITAGNTGDAFVIGGGTGAITVAAGLDYETTGEYTLTVQAADGNGGEDTATVTVTVTDVAEDAPPAPAGLTVALADGTFSLSWTALTGAAKYEAQHKTGAADSQWTALPETTGVSAAYVPEGGPACSTEYQFRVRAYGDGDTYTEMWGPESGVEPVETATCNPEFGQDSYNFFVLETAAIDGAAGTVSATDPDQDTLTYSITGGNDDGKFAIDSGTGRLTVAGDLDLATTPAYSLTVEASDGQGGTATARVRVALTIADCANGTVVPQPTQNQHLVRDCSVLLTAKDTLRGAATLNWAADTPISGWDGVRRRGANPQYVGTLYLTGLGLDGSIPAVLAGLADLRRLDLDDNALTGSIPAALGSLEDLEQLYLFNNQLTGAIPTEFGKLRSMRILSLYDNDLTGAIPPELGNLERLRELLLDRNDITGELPTELGNLSQLRNLYVRDNRLTGAIPTELGSLANLTYLYLEGNSWTGCIPAELQDVENNDLDRMGLADCTP